MPVTTYASRPEKVYNVGIDYNLAVRVPISKFDSVVKSMKRRVKENGPSGLISIVLMVSVILKVLI